MAQYQHVVWQAMIAFPILAAVVTLPYLIYCYRRYGSVLGLRVPIIYSFILYLLCCYFLVIMPLPSREYVAKLTGPRLQLMPFAFIGDIGREAGALGGDLLSAVKSIIANKATYQALMNLLMFVPFGVYLHYYFGYKRRRVVIASLGLSLFFELTQLTGLYFIYPRSYRLFDVDDLMMNTLGGFLGYLAAIPLAKFLPSRADINRASYRRSQKVSLLRRLVALFCDAVCAGGLVVVVNLGLNLAGRHPSAISDVITVGLPIFGYFAFLPIVFNSQTVGQKLTRMQVARLRGKPARWYQLIMRIVIIAIVMVAIPYAVMSSVIWLDAHGLINGEGTTILSIVVLAGYGFFVLVQLIRALARRPLFYERWTRTKLVSTTAITSTGQLKEGELVDDEVGKAESAETETQSEPQTEASGDDGAKEEDAS